MRSPRGTYRHAGRCILLCLLLTASAVPAAGHAPGQMHFNHLRVEDGLSQGIVVSFLQDREGFMWFGTYDGLNRYDGYRFTVWRSDPDNHRSLSSNVITALAEDRAGRIWIGTAGGGLNMYDPSRDEMRRFPDVVPSRGLLSGSVINALHADSSGTLWIGTDGDGLVAFQPADGTVRQFLHNPENAAGIGGDVISDIAPAGVGRLWIGLAGVGVDLVDCGTGRAEHFRPADAGGSVAPGVIRLGGGGARRVWAVIPTTGLYRIDREQGDMRPVPLDGSRRERHFVYYRSVVEASDGRLWIGTESEGLSVYDPRTRKRRQIRHNPFFPSSLPAAGILALYEDRAGNVWLGTNGRGVSFHSPAHKDFHLLREIPGKENSISVRSFRAIYQHDSVLWIGGYGGFNRLDRSSGTVRRYPRVPVTVRRGIAERGLQNQNVFTIAPDPEAPARFLLLGTEGDGVYRFDTQRHVFIRQSLGGPADSTRYMGRMIYEFLTDRNDRLWIGSDLGLSCREAEGRFTHYVYDPGDPSSISQGSVYAVFQDSDGYLWIGTDRGGLCHFDAVNRDFTRFLHDPDDPASISSNRVNCIFEDSRGLLWIGTSIGLNLLDKRNATFRHFGTADGFPNDVIYAIQEDGDGSLWISTNRGIARFHPHRGVTGVYDVSDGLQGNEFNFGASYASDAGEMFFGGVNGLTYFFPGDITRNTFIPPVRVTRCTVGGTEVRLGRDARGRHVLRLAPGQETVGFEFAALNFFMPEKNRYMYMLEGMHQRWVDAGTERSITFLALPPGEYRLRIKASNNDGVWNHEGTTVLITVSSPFWATLWFRILVGLLLVGLGIAVFRWRVTVIRRQEVDLARTVEDRTSELRHANAKLLQEIEERKRAEAEAYRANATKTEFLAHLSHEIRTPMNAILGFTELLMARIEDEQQKGFLRSIEVSGATLLKLINDILDLSKIEAGRIELELLPIDPRELLQDLQQVFAFQIRKQGLDFQIVNDEELPHALMLDQTRVRQILFNLVGNAVKYTESGGITVEVRHSDVDAGLCTVHLIVRDTGIGIAPTQQEAIFEPFRQAAGAKNAAPRGSGLGLAITKRLVDAMGGSIRVDSRLGQGSTFHVVIPGVQIVGHTGEREAAHADDRPESSPQEAASPVEPASPPRDSGSRGRPEIPPREPGSPGGPESPPREPALSAGDADPKHRAGDAGDVSEDDARSTPDPHEGDENERQKELRDLYDRIMREAMPRWERVSRSYHIQEMEQFAHEVQLLAAPAAYAPLLRWARELLSQAERFDMDRIPRTLHEFGSIVDQLNARITDPSE